MHARPSTSLNKQSPLQLFGPSACHYTRMVGYTQRANAPRSESQPFVALEKLNGVRLAAKRKSARFRLVATWKVAR
jgi:hypothetical protein